MVISAPTQPPEEQKDYLWTMFLDSVCQRSLVPALALLPEEKRTLYRDWLKQNSTSWWDPEAIWTGWLPMLNKLKIASKTW
jgi:hypothetical protein